ncbi:PREDICTED: excitatory amino acid transporter 3-like [Dufourea novaeangliae]|uniref:excitatory amino acid transporter 3-like n=1 Tax=Dufourea novaeangliae TaxID=178035 RepID=UPI000767C1D5|nr:PREDICTED: excitatory amino acid transporter 3-like [Dufourea novaeangliae]
MNVLRNLLKQKLILRTVIGVFAGIVLGSILKICTLQPWSERNIMYLKFPGELFMRLVNCLILPLIISSIVSATCNLRKSGQIGLMALYYYTTTTILGIILSVILVETIKPGEVLQTENIISQNSTRYFMTVDTILDLFRNLIPDNMVNTCLNQYQTVLEIPENKSVALAEWRIDHKNAPGTNILGLVFFSLLLGLAIGNIDEKGEPLKNFFHSLSETMMKIMNWTIMTVPISVLFLISAKILEVEDFGSIIKRLGVYMFTVFSGLFIQGFVVLPLLYFICTRQSPYKVIFKLGPAFATAFGTSSSTATVPVTMACLEHIGISTKITKFIVPIGATINMDGIALYETIGAIFIIQLHGLQYSLFRLIIISITCTLSCIGAAGLPSGGYVMLIMVLNSVGVPAEDVSLIIAIDWFV